MAALPESGTAPAPVVSAGVPDVFGLRVLRRFGVAGVLRVVAAVWLAAMVVMMVTVIEPGLANQTAIGTDSSNYYAAGERLNAGHPLYRLSPGDRPVPPLPPPHSSAPLLSPPLLGVVWRPLAALGEGSMVAWWLAGATALGALALVMLLTGSNRRSLVIMAISPFIALAMWSGNVNPFLVVMITGAWYATTRGRSGVAGGLIAVAAALKLAPAILAWWFVVRRDWRAVGAFLVVGAAAAAVSLAGAGLQNHVDYLAVGGTTLAAGASPGSVPGFLANSGAPAWVVSISTYGWILGGLALMWLLRHRPGASFVVGVLTVLYGSPVVLLGNLALLLAACAPADALRRPWPSALRASGTSPSSPPAMPATAAPAPRPWERTRSTRDSPRSAAPRATPWRSRQHGSCRSPCACASSFSRSSS